MSTLTQAQATAASLTAAQATLKQIGNHPVLKGQLTAAQASNNLVIAALTAPAPTPPAPSSNPSGIAMPTGVPISYTPGASWVPLFSDDFVTAAAEGSFLSNAAYSKKWQAYPNTYKDTSGAGTYEPGVLGASNSCMFMSLGTVGGVVQVCAPAPIINGDGNAYHGQLYGRYDFCFKADSGLSGFKTAWLLWPDSEVWADGEIDFPEGDLGGSIGGFVHNVTGSPSVNVDSASTSAPYTEWHTGTIEWSPSAVIFALDGRVVMTCTNNVGIPVNPMHFIFQTETDGGAPPVSSKGNVYVDWVVIYSLTS
jgi:hypothetical protein